MACHVSSEIKIVRTGEFGDAGCRLSIGEVQAAVRKSNKMPVMIGTPAVLFLVRTRQLGRSRFSTLPRWWGAM